MLIFWSQITSITIITYSSCPSSSTSRVTLSSHVITGSPISTMFYTLLATVETVPSVFTFCSKENKGTLMLFKERRFKVFNLIHTCHYLFFWIVRFFLFMVAFFKMLWQENSPSKVFIFFLIVIILQLFHIEYHLKSMGKACLINLFESIYLDVIQIFWWIYNYTFLLIKYAIESKNQH